MDELFNQFFALLLVAATTIIAPTSAASLATASAPVSTTPTAAPAFLLGRFAFDASDGFSFNLVFFSHVQNSNPPSRAASASAFTRPWKRKPPRSNRSEEHTSELQSLMRISYAVFCLKKKKQNELHHISS